MVQVYKTLYHWKLCYFSLVRFLKNILQTEKARPMWKRKSHYYSKLIFHPAFGRWIYCSLMSVWWHRELESCVCSEHTGVRSCFGIISHILEWSITIPTDSLQFIMLSRLWKQNCEESLNGLKRPISYFKTLLLPTLRSTSCHSAPALPVFMGSEIM